MSVNLSIKDVPDDLAERLRARAARNHRSLQGELMAIVEQAAAEVSGAPAAPGVYRTALSVQRGVRTIEELAEAAQRRFPKGTSSSVDFIRAMRDSRDGTAGKR
jgi:plasmid stability protein